MLAPAKVEAPVEVDAPAPESSSPASSGWLKIQSIARSSAPAPVSRKALRACAGVKPMSTMALMLSAVGSDDDAAADPDAAGNGASMSASSMCSNSQFIAVSAPPD